MTGPQALLAVVPGAPFIRERIMATRKAGIRKELEAQAERLRTELSELSGNARPSGIGQRSGACGDVADQATAYANREQSRYRAAMLGQRLEQVTDALQRLEDGTYGKCTACGARISPERLEVLPTATLCLADRQGLEHGAGPGSGPPRPMSTSAPAQAGHQHG